MIGVIVNTATVLLGSLIGLLANKGIPKRFTDAIMLGIGLCTIYIGIAGALKGENTVILIVSIVLGAALGTALDLDGKLNALGGALERRFTARGGGKAAPVIGSEHGGRAPIAQGFVTGSLLFCVGSMTIVGSLNAGLTGDNTLLFTKATLDFVSSMMLSVSLGVGVILSAGFVFVFQGALVLLARFLQPLMENASMIAEMNCAGSVVIIALGLNLIGITKIKVADYLPAIVFAPVLCWIVSMF